MKLLTVAQVAEILQVPKARVYELVRQGKLPKVPIGRTVRISEDELRIWAACGGSPLASDKTADAGSGSTAAPATSSARS